MTSKNYYDILGIGRQATDKEIKTAFRKLSLKYHPDRQSGKTDKEKAEAEEKFKDIAEAYSVLSDSDKRAQYDRLGSVDGLNLDEVLWNFSGMGGFGADVGGRASWVKHTRPRGGTIRVNVDVTIREIYERAVINVTYERNEPCSICGGKGVGSDGEIRKCPHCHGAGVIQNQYGLFIQRQEVCPYCHGTGEFVIRPCPKCGGSGLERKTVTVQVQIPCHCAEGVSYLLQGQGHYSERNGGDIGNLEIVFHVKADDCFRMEGPQSLNVSTVKEVSVIDCMLGGEQIIRGLDGKNYRFRIKCGCEDGTVYSVKGKGMPGTNGTNGDLLVHIRQVMPKALTEKDVELLTKLKESPTFKK